MRYVVQRDYASDGVGPFVAGQLVDLAEAQAAWIERDAPGTLRPAPEGDAGARSPAAPSPAAQDRMVKAPRQRRGGTGPITKAGFKAVKE